jgi:NAD(P)H-hydrate repair Nnr-like enzyme with NAD(P)H-hydrate dehydratase domain
MNHDYWHKQTSSKPLFPELIWSRPENRQLAGKLLIIGGNLHGFAIPAEAYNNAVKAGVGTARVLMPDAIKTLLGNTHSLSLEMEFASSTSSGSFNLSALAEFLSLSSWADGVLLAGDLGRNSETAILLEKFIEKYQGQMTLTNDAVEYFNKNTDLVLHRPNTTLVLSVPQLQKLLMEARYKTAVTSNLDLMHLVEVLHEFTEEFSVNIVVKQNQITLTAVGGHVCSTEAAQAAGWQIETATHISVWWLQNPAKPFEAITAGALLV